MTLASRMSLLAPPDLNFPLFAPFSLFTLETRRIIGPHPEEQPAPNSLCPTSNSRPRQVPVKFSLANSKIGRTHKIAAAAKISARYLFDFFVMESFALKNTYSQFASKAGARL